MILSIIVASLASTVRWIEPHRVLARIYVGAQRSIDATTGTLRLTRWISEPDLHETVDLVLQRIVQRQEHKGANALTTLVVHTQFWLPNVGTG